MPVRYPIEFRERAVELARERAKPVREIARDLGIAESCLRRWMNQAEVDAGRREGVSSSDRAEVVELRRKLRTAEMEIEVLKRAAAYFARRTSSQNDLRLHRPPLRGPA